MMTDKIYTDIRVYRFRAELVNRKNLEARSEGPVPIFNDESRIIGFASILNEGGATVAMCAIDPSTPERLDLETDTRKYWLDAALEFRGFVSTSQGFAPTVVWVQALRLTTKEIECASPIGTGDLS